MEYKITEKQCGDRIPVDVVCSQCGGALEPIETVDNANNPTFWCGCKMCCRFDNGVSSYKYYIAKELVENRGYRHYHHIEHKEDDSEETKAYKIGCQISGACDLVGDVLAIQKIATAL